ncbi:hypothetical protein M9Y10_037632, partial [Tritrichomonas musculus]
KMNIKLHYDYSWLTDPDRTGFTHTSNLSVGDTKFITFIRSQNKSKTDSTDIINTFTTTFEDNISVFVNDLRKTETDKYLTESECDTKYALNSNVITEEQLIKKCAIDCGPFTEGADISIHYLKIINNAIKLEYVVGNHAERNEIRILFYDTAANPHNIVILLYQRTIYFDNFQYSAYYEEILDLSSGRPLTYSVPMAEYNWTTTQELLDARQIYSRQIMVPAYLAKFKAAIYGTQSNTTITHYSPIESSMNSVNDFVIGSPVYMTGKVYKHVGDEWKPSTADDTTDCICSVKTSGTWKEYVGICVRIDDKNKCITFASHGDYLVKVNDSSCYGIGDEVFIDNEDNKLKVLSGETAITSKIKRMTVGIITSIIDERTLAVFKE